ncbi:unnamed protein product [Pedinophyceae sp. YPF-701]|nr:unnamed protein product [Pedinophyceae sp. YPF-701]
MATSLPAAHAEMAAHQAATEPGEAQPLAGFESPRPDNVVTPRRVPRSPALSSFSITASMGSGTEHRGRRDGHAPDPLVRFASKAGSTEPGDSGRRLAADSDLLRSVRSRAGSAGEEDDDDGGRASHGAAQPSHIRGSEAERPAGPAGALPGGGGAKHVRMAPDPPRSVPGGHQDASVLRSHAPASSVAESSPPSQRGGTRSAAVSLAALSRGTSNLNEWEEENDVDVGGSGHTEPPRATEPHPAPPPYPEALLASGSGVVLPPTLRPGALSSPAKPRLSSDSAGRSTAPPSRGGSAGMSKLNPAAAHSARNSGSARVSSQEVALAAAVGSPLVAPPQLDDEHAERGAGDVQIDLGGERRPRGIQSHEIVPVSLRRDVVADDVESQQSSFSGKRQSNASVGGMALAGGRLPGEARSRKASIDARDHSNTLLHTALTARSGRSGRSIAGSENLHAHEAERRAHGEARSRALLGGLLPSARPGSRAARRLGGEEATTPSAAAPQAAEREMRASRSRNSSLAGIAARKADGARPAQATRVLSLDDELDESLLADVEEIKHRQAEARTPREGGQAGRVLKRILSGGKNSDGAPSPRARDSDLEAGVTGRASPRRDPAKPSGLFGRLGSIRKKNSFRASARSHEASAIDDPPTPSASSRPTLQRTLSRMAEHPAPGEEYDANVDTLQITGRRARAVERQIQEAIAHASAGHADPGHSGTSKASSSRGNSVRDAPPPPPTGVTAAGVDIAALRLLEQPSSVVLSYSAMSLRHGQEEHLKQMAQQARAEIKDQKAELKVVKAQVAEIERQAREAGEASDQKAMARCAKMLRSVLPTQQKLLKRIQDAKDRRSACELAAQILEATREVRVKVLEGDFKNIPAGMRKVVAGIEAAGLGPTVTELIGNVSTQGMGASSWQTASRLAEQMDALESMYCATAPDGSLLPGKGDEH